MQSEFTPPSSPKSSRRKAILIGVGVLLFVCVALGIVGALAGGGKGKKTPTSSSTAVAQVATTAPTVQPTATNAPKPTPTIAPTKTPKPTPTAKPTQAPKPASTGAPMDTAAITPQLKQFVDDHFGGNDPVDWYPKLTGVSVANHVAFAQTSLQPSGDDLQLATMACQNLSAFVFNNENKALGLNEVLISGTNTSTGQSGIPLVDRKGLSGSCDPLAQP